MNFILLLGLPGGAEWILILLAILLLFGGRKIPELMRGLGRGIREFNDARSSIKSEIEDGMKEGERKNIRKETERVAENKSNPEA